MMVNWLFSNGMRRISCSLIATHMLIAACWCITPCPAAEPTAELAGTLSGVKPALSGHLRSESNVESVDWTESDIAPAVHHSRPCTSNLRSTGIHLDTDFNRAMLDFQNLQTEKQLLILENNQHWQGGPTLLVGAQARVSVLAAGTNATDKFSYLGRFPTDFTGDSASDARLVHANGAFTAHVNSWINGYGEWLFSDVFTFPDFKQGSLQVRQAYVLLGDLTRSPWYGYIGKKNVSFGDMGTLSPFSQSVVWHYFGTLHEGIGVGYTRDHLNITLTGINGGRGIRVADSASRGKLNNLALNAIWEGQNGRFDWRLGAGFLLSTIYDAATAEHIDPNLFGDRNSAWDINGGFSIGPLEFQGEFVSTVNDWPVTDHPVLAYRAEGAYDTECLGYPSRLSVSWSEGVQGPSGSEFEFNQQLVLGWGMELNPYAFLSLEYVRSSGFAPLINITMVSDRDVVQDSFVGGMTIVL